jgi:hypothetical protein
VAALIRGCIRDVSRRHAFLLRSPTTSRTDAARPYHVAAIAGLALLVMLGSR